MKKSQAKRRPVRRLAKESTRERLINVAERLIAERGVGVSMREISQAAGQGNKSVVAYHFGSRSDLVLAVARHHAPDVEQRRVAMMAALGGRGTLAAWLTCTVKPITDHLAALGSPSWYARFLAGAISDPKLREVVFEDALSSPAMRALFAEVNARLPALPAAVFEARGVMSQHLIVNTCADYERALQARTRTPFRSWQALCDATMDALLGLWLAPVSGPTRC